MTVTTLDTSFMVGEYEVRYYAAREKSLAGWRVFLRGEFVFSSESRQKAESWALSRTR